jgi:flavin-dependent dehydrogenase
VARRAYFREVNWPATRLLFCYAKELLPAYGWVFPLGNGEANVGVGSFLGESRASDLAPAFARFRAWLARQGILDAAAPGEHEATDLLRTGMRGNALVADRLLAAGDAAGAIDPLSGEGVSQALGSGRLAAQAVQRALAAGRCDARALADYRKAMHGAYRSRARQARLTRRLLRSTRLVDALVRLAGRDAGLAGGLYEMLVGELEPRGLMRHAARGILAPRGRLP